MDDRELTKEPDDREDSKKRVVNAVNVISNVFYYLYHGSVVGALVYLFIYSQHCDQLNTRVANLEGDLLTFKFKNDQLMAFYQDVVLVLEKTVRSADLKLSDTKSSLRGKREIIGRDRLADISSLLRGRDGDDGAPGPPGPPGHAGVQGPPGTHGPAGIQGPAGTHGPSGIQGQPGQPGLPGRPGPQGKNGHDGLPGRDAYNLGAVTHYINTTISRLAAEVRVKMLNEKPCQCLKGDPGTDGQNGTNGKPGATGPSGLRGTPGSKGEQGIRGDPGNIGPPGTPGVQGQKGHQGLSGRTGSKGDMGSKGDIGKIGNPGQKGEAGLKGSPGARGAQDRTSVVNGDVRLNGTRVLMVGETTLSGAVETFYNGVWGYVCDDGYNTAGNYFGKVVCSNLGMRFVEERESYRVPTNDFILNDVRCKGTELSLTECWYSTQDNCDADEGIFVRCDQVRRIRKADRTSVVNGNVRLNGTRVLMVGETTLSGAVETFYNGVWGYVCDDDYDTAGNYFGKVVCSNLGMRFVEGRSGYRVPTDDFIMDDVKCKGTELSLTECWYSTQDNCGAHEGIFVRCVQEDGDVRLNGTRDLMVEETTLSGAVETFYNGTWGYVCDDSYSDNFGKVVCNNLGMRFVEGRSNYRVPTDDFIFDHATCGGTELYLTECSYETEENCSAGEGIFVRCDL